MAARGWKFIGETSGIHEGMVGFLHQGNALHFAMPVEKLAKQMRAFVEKQVVEAENAIEPNKALINYLQTRKNYYSSEDCFDRLRQNYGVENVKKDFSGSSQRILKAFLARLGPDHGFAMHMDVEGGFARLSIVAPKLFRQG